MDEIKEELVPEEAMAISNKMEKILLPVNSIDKKDYTAIWVRENNVKGILSSKGIPVIIHRKVNRYAYDLAKEVKGITERFDKAYETLTNYGISFIQVIVIGKRKRHTLTKRQIFLREKQRMRDELLKQQKEEQDKLGDSKEQSNEQVDRSTDLGVPSVSGTEHQPDEQQGVQMFQLPSNDSTVRDEEKE